jgi:Tannase and feruloyl esterase
MEEISMRRDLVPFTAALLTTTALSFAATAATCAVPAGVVRPDTTITAVQSVPAGTFMGQSNLPAFCRVAGTSKRTPTSNINFEVWLPSSGWNGRYEQVGNGGLAGSIVYSGMAIALREGYATASTDDGTAGDIPGFLTDFDKVADWRVYAVHETAQNAKAIVQTVYGRPAHHSYFTGCSKGGSEASSEIQRYPDEFDGVVGGAAGFNGVNNQVDTIWHIVQVNGSAANTTPVLAEGPLTLLHNAVIKACGRQDGGIPSDIYLNDPQDCHFNPAVLQCKAGQDPSTCLAADQIQAAQNLYAGPLNLRTGGSGSTPEYHGVRRPHPARPPSRAATSMAGKAGAQFLLPVSGSAARSPRRRLAISWATRTSVTPTSSPSISTRIPRLSRPNTGPSTIISTRIFGRSRHTAAKLFFTRAGATCSSILSSRSITTTPSFATRAA